MVESGGKSSNVSNDSTAHDQDWLMPGHVVLLQLHQDLLHVVDVLVHLVATMDQGHQADAMRVKVCLEFVPVVDNDLVIHHGHTPTQGLVDVGKDGVGGLQDTPGDLDGGGQGGGHHRLDGLAVRGGQGQTVAVSVDTGRVDSVRINGLQCITVIIIQSCKSIISITILTLHHHTCIVHGIAVLLDKVLHLQVGHMLVIRDEAEQGALIPGDMDIILLHQLLEQQQDLADGEVGEELELLGQCQKVQIMLKAESIVGLKDGKPGEMNQKIGDLGELEDGLDKVGGVCGLIDVKRLDGVDTSLDEVEEFLLVDLICSVVVNSFVCCHSILRLNSN